MVDSLLKLRALLDQCWIGLMAGPVGSTDRSHLADLLVTAWTIIWITFLG